MVFESFANECRASGLILDANVLTLLVVGSMNRNRIATFKRTSRYDRDAFDLRSRVIAPASRLYSIAHIVTEVSNLTDLKGPELEIARAVLAELISRLDEPHIPSRTATAHSAYRYIGLTDAALLTIAKSLAIPVLTDDVLCYEALVSEGIVAANFTHFRRAQLGIE